VLVAQEETLNAMAEMQPALSFRSSELNGGNPMATKKATRKYSKASGESVETEMKAMKAGKLKSGSGKNVTSRKQAIAIGLSKARKAGKKVPAKKS
jgi:hypothetical protein